MQFHGFPAAAVCAVTTDEARIEGELPGEIRDRIAFRAVDPVSADIDTMLRVYASTAAGARLQNDDVIAPGA